MRRTSRSPSIRSSMLKKEFDSLRRYGFTPAQATKIAKFKMLWVGHIGDINWMDHGGGPVYRDAHYPSQFMLDYVEPPYGGMGKPRWTVYRVPVSDRRMLRDYLDGKRLKDITNYSGVSAREIASALRSSNPLAWASVAELIADYYGWHELDSDPLILSKKEMGLRYGEEPDWDDDSRDPLRRRRVRNKTRGRR